jgi:hypothetical protein
MIATATDLDIRSAYTRAYRNYLDVKTTFLKVLKNKDMTPEAAARISRLIKINETLLEICEKGGN